MKRKTPFVAAALAAGLFFYSSCTPAEKDGYKGLYSIR